MWKSSLMSLDARWVVFPPPIGDCTWGPRYKSVTTWDGVEERLKERLRMWKRQYISKGGRATLIKSMLSSLLLVRLRLEQILEKFLVRRRLFGEKPHLVRWETVFLNKENGGMGVNDLVCLNKALLSKWMWCFASWVG